MKFPSRQSGFTLIELLVVIAIIGILAAIAMPTLGRFKAGDTLAAGVRQIQDDVARARQYAISQRTTVFMVFCPESFWTQANFNGVPEAPRHYDKQLRGYGFLTLRSVGDQPGQRTARYLGKWSTLPDGVIIPEYKFAGTNALVRISDFTVPGRYFDVFGFATNAFPFPTETGPPILLPYVAFNHLGQLTRVGSDLAPLDELIPVARGSVSFPRLNGVVTNTGPATLAENPPGNSTNNFLIVRIDRFTGRARVEKQEFR